MSTGYLDIGAVQRPVTGSPAVNTGYLDIGAVQRPVAAGGVQVLRPASDVSAGAWVPSAGSDLFATIDESVASDADYNYTLSESAFEVALGAGTDPALSTGHVVRYRAAGNGVLNLRVGLIENTTVRATWTEAAAATAFTDYSHTLTGGEADAITDYTNLRLRFTLESA